jgi:hypothetical protein
VRVVPCSWSASTLTTLPSLTVTRTWALPYCVATASPVAVPATVLELSDELVVELLGVDGFDVVVAVAGRTVGE